MNLDHLFRRLSAIEFTLFTTVELCEIAGYPPGAAPRLARALRAQGFQTVPSRGVHIRRLVDEAGKQMKKCKVWFVPMTNEEVPGYLRKDVGSVRRHYNHERLLANGEKIRSTLLLLRERKRTAQ